MSKYETPTKIITFPYGEPQLIVPAIPVFESQGFKEGDLVNITIEKLDEE